MKIIYERNKELKFNIFRKRYMDDKTSESMGDRIQTHPTHNGVVTQGFFDYPTDIYNKLKKDTEQFKYGTTFRIEQEYPKGKWVFLCLMDVKVPLQNEDLDQQSGKENYGN